MKHTFNPSKSKIQFSSSDIRLDIPGRCPRVHLHLRPRHLPRVPEGGGHGPAAPLPGGRPRHGGYW